MKNEKPRSLREILRDYERIVIIKALQAADCEVYEAAANLGVRHETLYRRIKSLNINLAHLRAFSNEKKL